MNTSNPLRLRPAGFTLVELSVSLVLLTILLVMLVQMTNQTSRTWTYATGKAEQFREARAAFETMTRRIGQATLNTYWDYDNPNNPTVYNRYSELRFICGPMQSVGSNRLDVTPGRVRPTHGVFFHAPFGFVSPVGAGDADAPKIRGLDSALNTWGYYLEVNDDSALRPPHVDAPVRVRSRLMELMQPTSAVSVYKYTSGTPGGSLAFKSYQGLEWFRDALANASANGAGGTAESAGAHALAENIIALAILPRLSDQDLADPSLGPVLPAADRETALAPQYFYHSATTGAAAGKSGPLAGLLNSKHQLPPVVQVTMVAIDETSAQRLRMTSPTDDPLKVGPSTRFLTTAANYRRDLFLDRADPDADSLERRLIDAHVNYRIFTSNVLVRGAKWSREQTK